MYCIFLRKHLGGIFGDLSQLPQYPQMNSPPKCIDFTVLWEPATPSRYVLFSYVIFLEFLNPKLFDISKILKIVYSDQIEGTFFVQQKLRLVITVEDHDTFGGGLEFVGQTDQLIDMTGVRVPFRFENLTSNISPHAQLTWIVLVSIEPTFR